jgi:hypothetical protein
MNDLQPGTGQQRPNATLFWAGLTLLAIPALCLVITVVSTGHEIQGSGQSMLFWLVYLGLVSGICTAPLGLILLIIGVVQLARKN